MNRLLQPIQKLLGFADRRLPSVPDLGTGFGVSFRTCLLLCIPALLVGGYLRFELMRALPVIYYGPDSNSYFSTVSDLWQRGVLDIAEKRRWLYPLLLVPLPLSPFSPAVTLAWIQHIAGLLVVVPMGWIVGHVTRFRNLWIPVVTTLYAVWPTSLWYEHEMQAEPAFLAAFVVTTALAFPTARLADRKGIFLFLFSALVTAILKTLGKPVWAAFICFLLLVNRRPLSWGRRNFILLALTMLLIATSGSGRQGGWLFLSSTLPFLPEQGSYPEYRKILRPMVDEARSILPVYAFRQDKFKTMLNRKEDDGPLGPEWAAMVRDKPLFERVMKSLAFSAFLNAPADCLKLSAQRVFVAGSDKWLPCTNLDTAGFHAMQAENNLERWQKRKAGMEMLYRMPQAQVESLTASFTPTSPATAAFFRGVSAFFSWGFAMESGSNGDPEFGLRWPGWLIVAGLIVCLLPGRFIPFLPLWLPTFAYLAACFSVGDSLGRYLQPVEWAGIVLAAVALDAALAVPFRIRKRLRGSSKTL